MCIPVYFLKFSFKSCVIIIPAKLCNQRQFFSHDVELNNKGILDLHLLKFPTKSTKMLTGASISLVIPIPDIKKRLTLLTQAMHRFIVRDIPKTGIL